MASVGQVFSNKLKWKVTKFFLVCDITFWNRHLNCLSKQSSVSYRSGFIMTQEAVRILFSLSTICDVSAWGIIESTAWHQKESRTGRQNMVASSALLAANNNNGSNMISDQNQCWCVGFSLSFVEVYSKIDYCYFIVYHMYVNITCMSTQRNFYQVLNSAIFPFVCKGIFTPEIFGLLWIDQFVSSDNPGWAIIQNLVMNLRSHLQVNSGVVLWQCVNANGPPSKAMGSPKHTTGRKWPIERKLPQEMKQSKQMR